jgi:hypothetical protein
MKRFSTCFTGGLIFVAFSFFLRLENYDWDFGAIGGTIKVGDADIYNCGSTSLEQVADCKVAPIMGLSWECGVVGLGLECGVVW